MSGRHVFSEKVPSKPWDILPLVAWDASQAGRERKPLVFVSYSHRDKEWLDKLWPFLRQLEQLGALEAWADTGIGTGADWYRAIRDRMSGARTAILLVTQSFLASDFCRFEEVPVFLQRARQGKLTIFPVLLDSCNWQLERWLKRVQMKTWAGAPIRKAGADYTDVFAALAEEVRLAVSDDYQPPGLEKALTWASPPYDLSRLPETGSLLFGRERELSLLDHAWENPKTHLAVFVAGGGVGKSTLARVWCEMLAEEDFRGAERAFGWSFYSQGTGRMSTADRFIEAAFRFFGSEMPRELSMWDQGEKLAELVRQKKTLLVLDGLEPLQSDSAADRGSVRDPALRVLIESLAEENDGLCLVTTREPLADLSEHDAARAGRLEFPESVLHESLEQVSVRSGRALFRVRNVEGEDAELEEKVRDLGQHALAVNLYARAVADTPQRHVASIDLPPLAVPPEAGGHPRRVM
ncbi:MAG TPA: TIR domain-containing protein, partial [Polyangiaceae bacterium]